MTASDDLVVFLGELREAYPALAKSVRLELATWTFAGDDPN